MPKIKIEHVDNLRKGKKSGIKIGSRGVPHHLYFYEQKKYELALKKHFLEITKKDRVNLTNLWNKVCIAKGWTNLILIKDLESGTAEILKDGTITNTGDTKILKQIIKKYV